MVGVADSVVMILLSEMPSCWRYSTSRLGTSASHLPIAVDGSTSVTRIAQRHHQRDEASGRNEEPRHITDDATETL